MPTRCFYLELLFAHKFFCPRITRIYTNSLLYDIMATCTVALITRMQCIFCNRIELVKIRATEQVAILFDAEIRVNSCDSWAKKIIRGFYSFTQQIFICKNTYFVQQKPLFPCLLIRKAVVLWIFTRNLFTRLLVYSFTCLLVYLFTCLLVYSFTCLLVYSSTRLLVYSFTCLLVYSSTKSPTCFWKTTPWQASSCSTPY